jgi:ElaB/YqjD/DUF883 family membrane-anchored ribosome-binding protein
MDETTNKISSPEWDESDHVTTDESFSPTSSDEIGEQTDQIRAEIEDTRAEMGQTINEIQDRLNPEHLVSQVKESVREATIGKVERAMDMVGEKLSDVTEPAREVVGRAGNAIADSVWNNPIPIGLIGLGVGMLMIRRFGGNSSRQLYRPSRQPEPNFASANPERNFTPERESATSKTINQVKETASHLASRSTQTLSNLSSQAKDSAVSVSTRFSEIIRDNPLAVGAVAVAAGAAVGLALPSTTFEREHIGDTSEMLVDKAEQVARDAVDKVQNATQQMTGESSGATTGEASNGGSKSGGSSPSSATNLTE